MKKLQKEYTKLNINSERYFKYILKQSSNKKIKT